MRARLISAIRSASTVPAVLGLVLVVLLASSGAVWLRDRPGDGAAAMAVGREAAESFFSLHHETVAEDVDEVLALAVGDFKREYAERRAQVVKDVRARKLEVTAVIPEGGTAVEYVTHAEARVLVAVDVSSRSQDGVQDQRFRSRLTLKKVDGSWLVAELEQV